MSNCEETYENKLQNLFQQYLDNTNPVTKSVLLEIIEDKIMLNKYAKITKRYNEDIGRLEDIRIATLNYLNKVKQPKKMMENGNATIL